MSKPGGSGKKSGGAGPSSKAVVPRKPGTMAKARSPGAGPVMPPPGYTARAVEPAKNYDVISFARAMNDDFGGRVKQLFDPEREAVEEALQTGIYIGWRCPDFKHDCQRVSSKSKCFCSHLLSEHASYSNKSVLVPCKIGGCKCKAYTWIPSRPEEVGEFWFQRRRNFDPSTWRAKCRCKHTHEEHDVSGLRRCKSRGCGCGAFDSNFLCAACDRHWEQHETVFEGHQDRVEKGLPVGEDYVPFAEIPSLRNMVLTGEDDGDMSYMKSIPSPYAKALTGARGMQGGPGGSSQRALPGPSGHVDNNTPFGGGQKKPGFRPVYD